MEDAIKKLQDEHEKALRIVAQLNEENDNLSARLYRAESTITELEGTVDDLRNKLDRTSYR